MAQTDSQNDSPKGEKQKPRCDPEQLAMLKRCSEAGDLTEWNEWRDDNHDVKILLEIANLKGRHLLGANLQGANLFEANLDGANLIEAKLQGAELRYANLQDAHLIGANMEDADLWMANLQGAVIDAANLKGAHLHNAKLQCALLSGSILQGADLSRANLQDVRLSKANLQGANLWEAKLQGANLREANLEGANLQGAHIRCAEFTDAHLQAADFSRAIVDGETLIWRCKIDRKTKFEGVGLGDIRIDPESKQYLEYNIRRTRWEGWYKYKDWFTDFPMQERNKISQLFYQIVRLFWWVSDYGRITHRIIWMFFWFAIIFASAYRIWPNCVIVNGEVGGLKSMFHSVYFSVVTMTTLGFGDIYANPNSLCGQFLLMVQVLLGYMLLGALITRFAVLFTAGGPAHEFTETDVETKKKESG